LTANGDILLTVAIPAVASSLIDTLAAITGATRSITNSTALPVSAVLEPGNHYRND